MSLVILWFSGTIVYSTIYAVNGAGLTSAPVKTSGFTVDTTPPETSCAIAYGFNILLNSDFVQDLAFGWTHNDPMVETDNTGARYVLLEKDKFIKQTVVSSPLTKHRVTVLARSGELSTTQSHLNIDMPGHRQMVMLEVDNTTEWRTTYLYFSAQTTTSPVRLSTSGKYSQVQVKSVAVETMTCSVNSADKALDVHLHHTNNGRSSITASWIINDLQSPIVECQWAVGYVSGKCILHILAFLSTLLPVLTRLSRGETWLLDWRCL